MAQTSRGSLKNACRRTNENLLVSDVLDRLHPSIEKPVVNLGNDGSFRLQPPKSRPVRIEQVALRGG
jgi:hypothetical protein